MARPIQATAAMPRRTPVSHAWRRRIRGWLLIALPFAALVGALALRVADPPPVQDLRFRVFDEFQRLKPRAYQPGPVVVIDIDDESLRRLGQWPWPRTVLARLIARLQESGAAAIALDIVFPEPDRTSPAAVIRDWPERPETEAVRRLIESGGLPDHDAVLARTMAEGRVVVGFALGGTGKAGGAPLRVGGIATVGADPSSFLIAYDAAVPTLPEIAEAAAGNGSINVQPERDGVIRRVPLLITFRREIYPSLPAEALRVAQGGSTYIVKSSGASGAMSFGENTGISQVKIGGVVVPTDAKGRIWLYDTGPVPERILPAWKVLSPDFDPDRVAGFVALVGTSAAGLKDLRATPLDPAAAGIAVHAQLVEQMLFQDFLTRPDWATGAEILFVLALGLLVLAGYLIRRLGAAWMALLTAAGIAAAFGLSWYAFAGLRLLIDPIYPAVTVLAIYLTASLLRYLQTETERRQIRHAFGYYMAPALVERLAERPELLKLGGEMRDLTILFCDVRGFTTISEQFNAEELTAFINRFLTPMTDIIMRTGGTIDKYMGDCIMAMWNAPLDDPDHAGHACAAALAMRDGMERLNAELRAEAEAAGRPHIPVRVGIGLNSGLCCVGNMGSQQRFDYSALGDDVNLASRLEGQCKTYGVDIILGENTQAAAPHAAALEIDLIQVKGKTRPVRIYALLGGPDLAAEARFGALREAQEAMLSAYRGQDWVTARAQITVCRAAAAAFELSDLYGLYEERIRYFEANPPGPGWDGVFISQAK